MIQPQELRIGNYVKYKDSDCIVKITNVKSVDILISQSIYDSLIPIELTHEILIKCGFQLLDNQYYLYGVWIDLIGNEFIFKNGQYVINRLKLKSLHQLQNLYYSLTQTELKYDTI
jgi:hypothetical protein